MSAPVGPPQVILVNPRMCSPRGVRMPLSLLALAAVLEGRYPYRMVDGNVEPDALGLVLAALAENPHALLAVTVMPGPQVAPAIALSRAVRAAHPRVPIVWGGYFPTLYADSAINAPYVDYVVRGQGEDTLLELLERLADGAVREIRGLTWREDGRIIHNPDRPFRSPDNFPPFPYERLGDMRRFLRPSFMGSRTAVHQGAIGCRFRCTFCGVASMFNGTTRLQGAERMAAALTELRERHGANAVQFYDHNFFDREETSIALIEALARIQLPWWCYARADTLAGFSARTWELLRKSRFTMAYIGAEAASDEVLRSMRKGSRVEHTLEVARLCRAYGVIPEFSFVLGGPQDPEGEIERTLGFIKRVKQQHPECEVVLYFYSPTPQRSRASVRTPGEAQLPVLERYGPTGPALPTTPEEWTEPQWIDYVCHRDAPWLSPRMRQRVKDFATVLACRFPTVQDYATAPWGKAILSGMARWRYATGVYRRPWELKAARRLVPLREPQQESL